MSPPPHPSDSPKAPPLPAAGFDGRRALEDLRRLCALGPRVSDSPAMHAQQRLLLDHFSQTADRTILQPFEGAGPGQGGPVALANLVASWRPTLTRRKLIGTHYDTRPRADADPRPDGRPFLGANDSASGVAVLMELARHDLGTLCDRNDLGLDLVCFDAEEFVHDDDDPDLQGSTAFARSLARPSRYVGALVLDMVAGDGATFALESRSYLCRPELAAEVWALAESMGCPAFRAGVGPEVRDDHWALLDAGVPSVAIVPSYYEHWHRLSDTPDACSADTLGQVGRVVLAWLGLQGPA